MEGEGQSGSSLDGPNQGSDSSFPERLQTSDRSASVSAMALPENLEIIGAGWCRTGTSSLKVALDGLGYEPCFHGRFIPYLPEFREECYAYATGKSSEFDVHKHFGRYRAAVDIPAGLIPLVLDAYPEAKVTLMPFLQLPLGVTIQLLRMPFPLLHPLGHPLQVILTVRDEEKWYRSVRDVIVRLYEHLLKPFFWHTRLGRQYTAIIGWGLQYMFHGEDPQ